MAEGSGPAGPDPSSDVETEHIRPLATRRDFLDGAGAGAVAVGYKVDIAQGLVERTILQALG